MWHYIYTKITMTLSCTRYILGKMPKMEALAYYTYLPIAIRQLVKCNRV